MTQDTAWIGDVRQCWAGLKAEIEEKYAELWRTPELPNMEHRSSALLCDWLEAHGFDVERGAHDIATDAPSVIERNDVDAVLIASPDRTHADLALAALAARKPALCEKPLAATPEDCLRVVRAEEKTGSQLIQVGFMRRFDPAYVRMRSALMTGRLGDPLMMHNFQLSNLPMVN